MFWAFSRPSSGAQWLQWQPLVLPLYCGDSRAVCVVGPAGWPASPATKTVRLSPRYEGKTRGCHCSHWAPDDEWENAWNMLSCKQTSESLMSHRACCHTCYTIQLMHYSHFKTHFNI
jgi:hypothetical protein